MAFDLYVHGDRWRAHLRATADAFPGIVPVAKGNGYGFGLASLARRASWLGVDTLAVGTYGEVPEVASRATCDILVLEPWRPFTDDAVYGPRIVHTLGRPEDVAALGVVAPAASGGKPHRVVLEGLTSMSRFGLSATDLASVGRQPHPGLRIEGHALHLPLGTGHADEVRRWLHDAPHRRWFVSHLSVAEISGLAQTHPDIELRPRIGTELWLGDPDAFCVRATVLDSRPVRRGDRVGYRQRRASASGTLLVVSGGTSHGIGLESPSGVDSPAQRAKVLARGGLEATGRTRSPFILRGRPLWFVEPPHMQVSLVLVPQSMTPPSPGDVVPVRVRFTTTTFDSVHLD